MDVMRDPVVVLSVEGASGRFWMGNAGASGILTRGVLAHDMGFGFASPMPLARGLRLGSRFASRVQYVADGIAQVRVRVRVGCVWITGRLYRTLALNADKNTQH